MIVNEPCCNSIYGCQNMADDSTTKDWACGSYMSCIDCKFDPTVEKLVDIKRTAEIYSLDISNLSEYDILKASCERCYMCGFFPNERFDHNVEVCNEITYSYCGRCIHMKRSFPVEKVIKYCDDIYDIYPSKSFIDEKVDKIYVISYDEMQIVADNWDKPFNITEKQYEYFMKQKCIFCKNVNGNVNRLERIIIENPYDMSNVVTCCNCCWSLKVDSTLDEFIQDVTEITEYNRSIKDHQVQKCLE